MMNELVVKAYFVSLLFQRLGFESLWADSYNHGLIDFAICSISYFVYLYMSFSGYCDVAIGSAGLLGIRIKENFNRPFTARNIQDFWARWHITLSDFMKELVFNPTLKAFMVKFGSGQRQLSIGVPLTMGLTFFLIGIWHGFHLNFVIYGVMQAVAVSVVHIYGNFLKKRLGTAGVARYKKNKWIFAASWLLTFSFMTLSLFVFQNSYEDARKILTELRLRP
jgi:D-alanyl-lipoteichoic acid acyltransferase DltB (MBOAT superfamily)